MTKILLYCAHCVRETYHFLDKDCRLVCVDCKNKR